MLFFLLPSPCSCFLTVHRSSTALPVSLPLQLPVSLCPQTMSVTLLPAFLLSSFCPLLPCFITSDTSFSLFSFLYHSDYYSLQSQAFCPSTLNSNPISLVVFSFFFPLLSFILLQTQSYFFPLCIQIMQIPLPPSLEAMRELWKMITKKRGESVSPCSLLSWPKADQSHNHRRGDSSPSTSALDSTILSTEKILKKTPHRGLVNPC